VPPGFFNELKDKSGIEIYEKSGEDNCRKLLSNIPPEAQLLELLWCKEGCHKGDGLL
jgi:hypothetical protein